jgi:hypothetical protein
MPIIINPDYNGIIYSHIISRITRRNLKTINKILGKIYKANLFNSNIDPNFTIFNCYLLEIIPTFNEFYKTLISVRLSDKIEKIMNMNSEEFMRQKESNEFYYFENYPEQIYNIQCICFSFNNILQISRIIEDNKKDFLRNENKDKQTFASICKQINDDFRSNKKKFINICNSNSNNYYIHLNKMKNPKYKDELFLKNSKFTFSDNENLEKENILSKVKYCIKKILKSINLINPRVYSSLAEADNTEKFFIGLDKIIELEDNSESIDTIPLNWYSMYMTNYFDLLSNNYKKNNFSLLYEELLKEAIMEIDKLKNISNTFNSKLGMNLRCSEKIVEYAKRDSLKLKKIENFIKIEKFMENAKIKVCIRKSSKKESNDDTNSPTITITPTENCVHQSLYYVGRLVNGKNPKPKKQSFYKSMTSSENNPKKYNHSTTNSSVDVELRKISKKSVISLNDIFFNSSNSNSSNNLFDNFKPIYGNSNPYLNTNKSDNLPDGMFGECHCESIFDFIREFQSLHEIKVDIVNGDAENKIGESLSQYLKIVYNCLDKDKLFSNYNIDGKSMILEDIENYILRKMYKSVFPEEMLDNDIKFNLQCQKFSWIQPKDLDIKKKLINEVLWQQGIRILSRLDYEKSPLDKLNCVQSVLKIIKNSINFCLCENENFAGADDQNPIFIYMVLKADLKKYISNINYIYTFIHDEKKTNYYGQTLSLMDFAKNYIMGMNLSYFENITKEEYDR